MKPQLTFTLVLFAGTSVLLNCGCSGDDPQKKHDLEVAFADLTAKKQARDSAAASEAALEKQAAAAESEMEAVAAEVSTIDSVRSTWGDDYRASIRDVDPTSIEKMVRESTKFIDDLAGLHIEDTPSSYKSAFAKYADACRDLAVSERMRLKIDYVHLNLADKLSNVSDEGLNDEQKDKLHQIQLSGDLADIAHWGSQNSDNNELIDKAVSDMSVANASLGGEKESAPQTYASQIQTLKSQMPPLEQAVSDAEKKVRSLGGTP